ncbi:hypothetical protein [Clavibacter sp.]|uniref:hypothetical protein n=1 Tax=Clavibacter sp. TaxID=1871044 RepID=UPI0019A712DB|nr:hypothetical protein [Clavibacter sp.]MBD5381959.1 hypothetical protein [Clavibacter sp.]
MKNKKLTRLGEVRKNKQGLTMQIVKYINSKCVEVEFLETGERIYVSYIQFAKGLPKADLLKHPSRTECSFNQAKWITIGGVILLLGIFSAFIYTLVK